MNVGRPRHFAAEVPNCQVPDRSRGMFSNGVARQENDGAISEVVANIRQRVSLSKIFLSRAVPAVDSR